MSDLKHDGKKIFTCDVYFLLDMQTIIILNCYTFITNNYEIFIK